MKIKQKAFSEAQKELRSLKKFLEAWLDEEWLIFFKKIKF